MNPEVRRNLFWPVLSGLVVALIAENTRPWWWDRIWKKESASGAACVVDKDFKANIYFNKRKDIKDRLRAELEAANYYGFSVNTDFYEFDDPGEPGTAWIVHPLCIKGDDQRLLKVIDMLGSKGYTKERNLFVFPNKSPKFTEAIQISIF